MKSTISYFPLALKRIPLSQRWHVFKAILLHFNKWKKQQSARCVLLQCLSNTATSSFVASRSPRTETADNWSMQKVRKVSLLSGKQAEETKCGCRNSAVRSKYEPLELHLCDQVTNKITEWAQIYINCTSTDLSKSFFNVTALISHSQSIHIVWGVVSTFTKQP